jgi:hypothetical protein
MMLMMQMYFYSGTSVTILFDWWTTHDNISYSMSLFVIMLLPVINDWITWKLMSRRFGSSSTKDPVSSPLLAADRY